MPHRKMSKLDEATRHLEKGAERRRRFGFAFSREGREQELKAEGSGGSRLAKESARMQQRGTRKRKR